jgi:hypothetical protein
MDLFFIYSDQTAGLLKFSRFLEYFSFISVPDSQVRALAFYFWPSFLDKKKKKMGCKATMVWQLCTVPPVWVNMIPAEFGHCVSCRGPSQQLHRCKELLLSPFSFFLQRVLCSIDHRQQASCLRGMNLTCFSLFPTGLTRLFFKELSDGIMLCFLY